MDTILNILIVEDDILACKELEKCVAQYDDMKVVAVCTTSQDALVKAHYCLPNVIILDLELHHGGGNGLMFLDQLLAKPLSLKPFILVTTNNMSSVTLEQAKALGADFTLTKYEQGYCAQYVIDNIRILRNAILRKNSTSPIDESTPVLEDHLLMYRIQRELDLVGIKPKAKGYKYLADAIFISITESDATISRTLSEKYKKTNTSIERAMQNAIKQAWTTNDVEDLYKYYTAKIRSDKGYPTMMEFISYYSIKIKREVDLEKLKK